MQSLSAKPTVLQVQHGNIKHDLGKSQSFWHDLSKQLDTSVVDTP